LGGTLERIIRRYLFRTEGRWIWAVMRRMGDFCIIDAEYLDSNTNAEDVIKMMIIIIIIIK
jgi:hypothetical protein